MGFLKFLKREKKSDDLDELDLPPAPPPLEGFDKDFSFSDIPDLDKPAESEMPKFDFSEEDFDEMKKTSMEFPSMPEMQQKDFASIPPIRAPPATDRAAVQMPEIEEEQDDVEVQQPVLPREIHSFANEKRTRMQMGRSLYVRIDKFKVALGSINVVRNDLRKTEEALLKLENIKGMEEKSMNKMRSSLDDLQKKLVFVDKTLFEGE